MLAGKIIEGSVNPWTSPIIIVTQKDGYVRLSIYFRKPNAHTTKGCFPLPRIGDKLDSLQGTTIFSTLDLLKGYFHTGVTPESKEKTVLSTPHDFYEFTVLPFGLCDALSTFQRLMQHVLHDHISNFCLIIWLTLLFTRPISRNIHIICRKLSMQFVLLI